MAPARKKRMSSTPGRPTLLTPEVHKKIVDLVRGGNFPETAASAAGVSRPTLRSWMREGAELVRNHVGTGTRALSKRQRLLLSFLTDLDRAFGEAEARDVLLIGKHAEEDWRAAAWRLERRNRQQWAPLQRIEQTSAVVTMDAGHATESAREWVLAKIKRLGELQAAQRETEALTIDGSTTTTK